MTNPFKNRQAGPYGYGQKTDYNDRHLGIDWYTNFEPLVAPVRSKIISTTIGHEGGLTLVFQPIGGTRLIRWLHLNKFYVKPGQIVEEGQMIAQSGNSGHRPGTNAPYQPHTHDDHWNEKVTLKFKDTLDPKEYYEKGDEVQLVNDKGTVYLITGNKDKRKIGIVDSNALGIFGDEPQKPMDTSGIKQYNNLKTLPNGNIVVE